MIICGIDPGDKGGVSFLDTSTSQLIGVFDMPLREEKLNSVRGKSKIKVFLDGKMFAILLEQFKPDMIVLERILPGYGTKGGVRQGAISNANFFGDVMYLKGIMDALNFSFIEVLPQHWKKPLGLIGQEKEMSVNLAMSLFSSQRELFYRQNKRDKNKLILLDGRAESALIAYYFYKKENGL